ncbi:hypothetical protein RF679_04565 [Undibacterium cyanobacteriorum]|uniref:Uncharacterized protein n=1 Tax=Undibacterium cyanobacteriorum TaxID=3073561 RepID=A0ABY9RL53_9BURK|nr:hypothetical protein [Undibacterium sp. 20NA77.5]WMW81559.1 hypothetical protein RF679_04565 [Undibacterium sp. 20NA77.5]
MMINKKDHPVEWAGLMYELEDAHEHLGKLITEMNETAEFDEVDFRIQLQHVFQHLSRAWHRGIFARDMTEAEWEAASQFPQDLDQIQDSELQR